MYDAIVVGAGAMGSAAFHALARRGMKTLAIEQFEPGHDRGSSHGSTRIYRTVYLEGPEYVPLTRRAQELWRSLEKESGVQLILRTGALMIGPAGGPVLTGARRSAEVYRLPHEDLTASDLHRRFPAFSASAKEEGLYDPEAGILFPERCVQAFCAIAQRSGGELLANEHVRSWTYGDGKVSVRTDRGEYSGRHLVLAAGAWLPSLVPELARVLRLERQTVHWFRPAEPALCSPGRMPVFVWDRGGEGLYYGLPDVGEGVKVSHHGGRVVGSPEGVDRAVSEEDRRPVRSFLARCLPAATGEIVASGTCLYTMAPNDHFLVGAHPRWSNVTLVSACSGHGFKFASAIGEHVAERSAGATPSVDLSAFDPKRCLQ